MADRNGFRKKRRIQFPEHLESRIVLDGAGFTDVTLNQEQIDLLQIGVAGLEQWGQRIAEVAEIQNAFEILRDAAGDDIAFGNVFDIPTLLDQQITTPSLDYLATTPAPDTRTLLDAMRNAGLEAIGGETALPRELRFEVGLQETVTLTSFQLDLGADAESLGFGIDADLQGNVTFHLDFSFTFGIKLDDTSLIDPNVSFEDAFFVRDVGLQLSSDLSFDGAVNAHVGFADVTASVAPAGMTGNVHVDIGVSPSSQDTDGNTTLEQLTTTPLGTLLDVSPVSNEFQATMTLAGNVGAYAFPGSPTLTLQGSPLGGTTTVTANADFAPLTDFNNIEAGDLLIGLGALGSLFVAVGGSSVLDVTVPFTQHTLGSLLDVDSAFQNGLAGLVDPTSGLPQFSAQSFTFGDTTTVDFNPATKELRFDIELDLGSLIQEIPFRFGGAVEKLNSLVTDSLIELASSVDSRFSIVVDISNPIEPGISISGSGEPDDGTTPPTPTQAISLANFEFIGSLTQSLNDFLGNGIFGIIGLEIGEGTLDGLLDFELTMPTTQTLSEILIGLANPADLLDLDLGGATEIVMSGVEAIDGLVDLPNTAELRLRVQDFANGLVDLIPTNIGELADLADISFDQILELLDSELVDNLIADLQGKIDQALSVVGTRVEDVLDSSIGQLVEQLRATLTALQEDGAVALQSFLTQLDQNIVLEGLVDFALSSQFDVASNSLLLNLEVAKEAMRSQPFDYDFAPFSGGSGISTLGDFSLAGNLDWDAAANLQLDVGIDISAPTKPVMFLSDSSHLAASLYTSSTLSGALHGLGLTLTADGTGRISSTTDPAAPATFQVNVVGASGGRLPLSDIVPANVTSSLDGMLDLDLDTELLPSTGKGTQPFHLQITDLADPLGTATVLAAPDFAQMLDDIAFGQLVASLATGVDELLTRVENAIDQTIGVIPLPLVDGALAPANAVGKFHDFLQPALDALQDYDPETVKSAIEDALEDAFGDTFVVELDDRDPLNLLLHIRSEGADSVAASVNSNLGLPALGAQVEGSVDIHAEHTFDLTFGANPQDGVYLVTGDPDELTLDLEVLYDGSLTGRLGFLDVIVSNANAGGPAFQAGVDVNLKDPNDDGKLTLSELAQFRFQDHVEVKTNADIDLAFAIETQVRNQDAIPSIVSQLDIAWDIVDAITSGEAPGAIGDVPLVSFTNVGLNLGEFLTELAAPYLEDVYATIEPILPVIEALTSPLPVISDLAQQPITLVDLVQAIFPNQNLEFLDTVNSVLNILASIDLAKDDAGRFQLTFADLPFGFLDLREPDALEAPGTISLLLDPDAESAWDSVADNSSTEVKNFAASVETSPGEFDFALLSKPARIFELLLGLRDDVELVTWDAPSLRVYAPMDLSYPVFPGVNAGLFGALEFIADINVGYDTFGLSKFLESNQVIDLFDGFYISDTANLDGSGPDVPEALVRGELKPQVSVGVSGILEVGAAGGLTATLGADLVDPNGDGKMRPSEFLQPESCLFALGGDIGIEFDVFAKVAGQRFHYPFAYEEIANFNLTPECPYLIEPFVDKEETLAELEADGTLRLLVGDAASRRSVEQAEIDENYVVRYDLANRDILVQAFGYVQTFAAVSVSKIVADAGDGNDFIKLAVPHSVEISAGPGNDAVESVGAVVNATQPPTVGVITLYGDTGEDRLTAAIGPQTTLEGGEDDDVLIALDGDSILQVATLRGGKGDDLIQAGRTSDIIDGGPGNDRIQAGDGENVVTLGTGDDTVTTGNDDDTIHAEDGGENRIATNAGNDTVYGGADAEFIDAGAGDDDVFGGDGGDLIVGGPGEDTLNGGPGNDEILGEEDDDVIHGGLGEDELLGGPGEDEIEGGVGADYIDGGLQNDTLRGGPGNDEIYGDQGDDTIEGNLGNDTIRGGDGNDTVDGNENDDTISGDAGDDEINGNEGEDYIDGGPGKDLIHGNASMDTLLGGPGDDTIFGDKGQDIVDGGPDDDTIYGGPDGDLLRGGSGDDTIFGEDGDDDLYGDLGNDQIFGGHGHDQADGGDGNDLVNGEQDNDTLRGGNDNDLLLGFGGDDKLFGGPGIDILRGGVGNDWLDGGQDDDRAFGGEGINVVRGGKGDDTLEAETGQDILFGNEGHDQLYGGPLPNRLHGGPGDDQLYGESGVGALLEGADGDDLIVGSGDGESAFATSPASGDIIRGGAGNDTIRGLGGADDIDGGPGLDTIDGGSDADQIDGGDDLDTIYQDPLDTLVNLAANKDDQVVPRPASVTSLDLGAGDSKDQAVWPQLDGSATGGGISQVGGREQTVLRAGDMTYVAWVDDRNGNNEIYVARGSGNGLWTEINGSASGGGVSQSEGDSRQPALMVFGGQLVVGWTETTPTGSRLVLASEADWTQAPFGVTPGQGDTAHDIRLTIAEHGFLVAWVEQDKGNDQVHVARYTDDGLNPPTWTGAFNVTEDVSPGTSVIDYDFAAVENQAVAVWSTDTLGGRIVEVAKFQGSWNLEHTFDEATYHRPTVAVRLHETFGTNESSIDTMVAMERTTETDQQVVAFYHDATVAGGDVWQAVKPKYDGDNAARVVDSISDTLGYAAKPELASGRYTFYLGWADDNFLADADGHSDIYIMGSSTGAVLFEQVDGDASGTGISSTGGAPRKLSISNAGDLPSVAWTDTAPGRAQAYLRQENASEAVLNVPEFGVAGHPISISGGILDDRAEITQVIIDWGDGTVEPADSILDGTFSSSHVFNEMWTYKVSVQVIDARGVVSVTSDCIFIGQFEVDTPVEINENESVMLTGRFFDTSPFDTNMVRVRWGDNPSPTTTVLDPGENSFAIPHFYANDGLFEQYSVQVELIGIADSTITENVTAVVRNVAPLFDADSDKQVTIHQPYASTIDFTDPGTLDIHTVVVDWGDGSEESIVLPQGVRSHPISHTYAVAGDFDVQVTVRDNDGGSHQDSFLIQVTRPDSIGPAVTGILVGGTGWSTWFVDDVDTDLGLGYSIPRGSAEQTAPLPWSHIDQLAITFSSDVKVAQTDLGLFGVLQQSYLNAILDAQFAYDASTYTAVWTFGESIPSDRLLLTLSDRVENLAGFALDGEWTDNVTVESGNGVAGGDFAFQFNVLGGDANQDGIVDEDDLDLVRTLRTSVATITPNFDALKDIDASGVINGGDLGEVRLRDGESLPVGEPKSVQAAAADAFFANPFFETYDESDEFFAS